jgi:hypothetical protein
MDWDYYEPKLEEEYCINTFDDGNEKYRGYVNVWHPYGEWRGKVALVNKFDTSIRIESISYWKLDLIKNTVEN